jgi:DNA-binding PadR family transcriptional regulator
MSRRKDLDGKKLVIDTISQRPMSLYDLDMAIEMHDASIRRLIGQLQRENMITIVGEKQGRKGQKINLYGLNNDRRI